MKYLLLLLIAILAACQYATAGAFGAIDQLVVDGKITPEQAQIMKEALAPVISDFSWDNLITAIVSIAGSLYGVKLWRGGIENRKGNVPTKS